MRLFSRIITTLCLGLLFTLASTNLFALTANVDAIVFNPNIDGGPYITTYGSSTLSKFDFNMGLMLDYGREPMEYDYYLNGVYQGRLGVIDDLVIGHAYFSYGFVDWFQAGIDVPFVMWNRFFDPPDDPVNAVRKNEYGMGDVRVEMKFRLLDINRYGVGIALLPFTHLPTGDGYKFHGMEQWNGGAKLIIDTKIRDRVFLSVNAGYHLLQRVNWDIDTPNAILDDQILMGGGIAVKITEAWSITGEAYGESVAKSFFKHEVQTPIEVMVGTKFQPQVFAKGFALTIGAGRGVTAGIGASDFRGVVGMSYHKSKVVTLPPPSGPTELDAQIEEKIIITQKIHFAFDKDNIRPVSYPILNDVIGLLQANPQMTLIQIEGHTDWIGSDQYNQGLSQRRANSVKKYLVQHGISTHCLTTVGYGESKPIADNRNDKGRARNRRTEFTVIENTGAVPSYQQVPMNTR